MKIELDKYPSIKAIHIIQNNELILNESKEGSEHNQLYPIGCVFKSFLSVLIGSAIKERRINSIEDCILDYVDHKEIIDSNWYKIKIKHALSKTTGLVWPGPGEMIPQNMNEVMDLNFESDPGLRFKYKPDPQLIVYLLENVYQCNIVDLFESKIVKYFNHKKFIWQSENIQDMSVSIGMLDELCQLMLHKGEINHTNLFSEQYYNQSILPYSNGGFPENTPYGLGWWLGTWDKTDYFYAAGFGGQRALIIPTRNITMSLISDMDRPHPEYSKIAEQLMTL